MRAYVKIIAAMLIWGTLPLFVNALPYSSAEIVLGRTALGFLCLLLVFLARRRPLQRRALKQYGLRLLLTGAVMGGNWAALFEAYRYVDVSVATLAYYCAPVLVMLGARLLFGERLGPVRLLSMAAAAGGMLLVTGAQMGGSNPLRGVLLGLLSAALYAAVTLSNKSVRGLSGLEITLVQLLGALCLILPYVLLRHGASWQAPTLPQLLCLLMLGFVHTGLALFLYFSAIQQLPGSSVALCSYLDPVSALFFAALFLHEALLPQQLLGAALILGGALCGQLLGGKGLPSADSA